MSAYTTLNPRFRRIVTHITTPLLFATALLIGCDSDRATGPGASPALRGASADHLTTTHAPEWIVNGIIDNPQRYY